VNVPTILVPVRPLIATLAVALVLPAHAALAQTATPAGPAAGTPASPPKARTTPVVQQGYTYSPEGRRDPFVSLVNRGSDQRVQSAKPAGVPGLSVGDLVIRGIVANNRTYIAMVQAPDGKTYVVKTGDQLYDATVKAVLADAVVFLQQVNDPLSLVKQREIRKPLRPTEEGK
jgi:Tfp pilus assembly protein PilP